MKVKTSELTGAALDYAVAMALGWECDRPQDSQFIDEYGDRRLVGYYGYGMYEKTVAFNPSKSWKDCGPLIEKFRVGIEQGGQQVYAYLESLGLDGSFGNTAMIAVCRAIVSKNSGEEVEVPDRLIE